MNLKKKSLFLALVMVIIVAFAVSACAPAKKSVVITKPEDLKGLKVGVQLSTTADDSTKELLKTIPFEVQKYDQIIQTFADLKTGRVDAVVVDEVVARDYAKKDPTSFKVTDVRLTNEPIGICFKKANDKERDKFNAIIDEFAKDGTLKRISEKWFGEDLTGNIKSVGSEASQGTSDASFQFPADKKKLLVGVDDTYPPMEFKDEKNALVGFDVDLATEIGKKLGMEVEFVSTAWDGIFTSLKTDKFDCIISSVSINEERLANFSITKPYIANAQAIVVKP